MEGPKVKLFQCIICGGKLKNNNYLKLHIQYISCSECLNCDNKSEAKTNLRYQDEVKTSFMY